MIRLNKATLERLFTQELGLKAPRFKFAKTGPFWNGSVISETFKRKSDHQRQRMIWDALKKVLGCDAQQKVGMVIAYTPEEWDIDEIVIPRARARANAG